MPHHLLPSRLKKFINNLLVIYISKELGPGIPLAHLTMIGDAVLYEHYNDIWSGDFIIYVMSKPRKISTWHLNESEICERNRTFVQRKDGPSIDHYGLEVAVLVSDISRAGALWVATKGPKDIMCFQRVLGEKQVPREWSKEV